MYRDELEQAKKRVDELDQQLAAQSEELAGLRAQLDKRLAGEKPRKRSRGPILVGGLGAMAVLAGGALWSTAVEREPAPPPSSVEQEAPPPKILVRPGRTHEVKTEARPQVIDRGDTRVPSEERMNGLAARCERTVPRASLDGLPPGTQVMDFKTCSDCACCLPGGEFPPTWDDRHKPVPGAAECRHCSRDATLKAAGVTVVGEKHDDPLWAGTEAVLRLARPARVLALRVSGGGIRITKEPQPDHEVAVIAHDAGGRPIDGAYARYGSWKTESERTDFSKLERVLLVEACPGESITRVDLSSSDLNLRVKAIALQPAR